MPLALEHMQSAFSAWLRRLIDERFDGNQREFVRTAEPRRDEASAQGYLSKVLRDQKPPPLDRVDAWAAALGLEGTELHRFREYAAISHMPERVQGYFVAILQELDRLRELADEAHLERSGNRRQHDGPVSDHDEPPPAPPGPGGARPAGSSRTRPRGRTRG